MSNEDGQPKPLRITVWVLLVAGLLSAAALLLRNAREVADAGKDLKDVFAPKPRVESASFREASVQVNVGCGDTASGSVTAALPEGAFEIQPRCEWVDTDANLKSAICDPSVVGTTVKATGSIVGLDRDFFGNCPGGGHGKLQVSGSYKIKVP